MSFKTFKKSSAECSAEDSAEDYVILSFPESVLSKTMAGFTFTVLIMYKT